MNNHFLKIAKQAALEAGKVILKYYGNKYELKYKNNDTSDFATQADLEAEEVITKILNTAFPDHNILAEEQTRINKNSQYTWAVDPLDGSISYVVGIPSFTVAIGLLYDKKPILGVIYHILTKGLYYAERGKAAFLNNKKIHVNRKNNLKDAVLSMDFGHRRSRKEKFNTYISPLINEVGYVYSLGSGALALAYTAKGVLEAHIETGGIWDVLAGAVIVREAGGMVTDFAGKEPDWTKERLNIVASNGLIHDQILEALRS